MLQSNQQLKKAMQKMFPELGTSSALKREIAFPESGDHVITSPILGNKTELPMQASIKFLIAKYFFFLLMIFHLLIYFLLWAK